MKNFSCVILAAGIGSRMNTQAPKSLHKICNVTMIERLIQTVKSQGIKHIVVVVGYGKKHLEEILKSNGVYTAEQKRLLGSADAVKAAKKYFKKFKNNIMLLYTDTPLLTKETLKLLSAKHINTNAVCTLLTTNIADPAGYGRILRNDSGEVIDIIEEKDATAQQKEITEINIGAYCFKKKELFDTIDAIKKNAKKGEFYLTDIVRHFHETALTLATCTDCPKAEALGVNSRQDLSAAEKIVRKRKISQLMQQGVTFVDPETAYIDEKVKIDKDTIIYPSVYIEGEVTIGKNCRIGPFARIRGRTKIGDNSTIGNFVEVVRSSVGCDTRIKHHSYIGDTTVGNNVNVGAGAITANYDGKNKNKTIIKDKAFIGVGAILIAPVTIGKKAMVGAGSVVTRNKNVPDNTTVVGVPAKPLKGKIK